MTTKNLLTFVFLFYFSISFAQPKNTFYGEVKSVREQLTFLDKNKQNMKLLSNEGDYGHYGFSDAQFTKDRFFSWWYHTPWVHYSNYYEEFNKQGKPTYEIWFYKNGDTVTSYEYKYDTQDNLIQVKEIDKKGDYTCTNYTYDYKNKVISELYYISNDPNRYSYSEYIYNEKGQLAERQNFHEEGKEDGTKYIYDSKGRRKKILNHSPYIWVKTDEKTRVEKRDSIGSNKIEREFFYNEENKIIEIHSYNDDNEPKIYRKTRNEYKNGLLKRTLYLTDTVINNYTAYEYDKDRRKIKEMHVFPKHPDSNLSSEYVYDKNGNLIKLIYTEKNTSIIVEFEYEFDSQKNWTKQIKSVNGEKLFVWTREIKYYENQ